MTDGVRTAVIVLMAITVAVLSGFGWFIARFVRRVRANEAMAERSEHQARGPKPHAASPRPFPTGPKPQDPSPEPWAARIQ